MTTRPDKITYRAGLIGVVLMLVGIIMLLVA